MLAGLEEELPGSAKLRLLKALVIPIDRGEAKGAEGSALVLVC